VEAHTEKKKLSMCHFIAESSFAEQKESEKSIGYVVVVLPVFGDGRFIERLS
jgi:hypothetical protein